MKYTLAGIIIVATAVIGWWLVAPSAQVIEVEAPVSGSEAVQPTAPTAPAPTTEKEEEAPNGTPRVTMEEVKAHATEASCWTVVNDSVYDLTSFVDKHPGGRRNVLKLCGTDGTAVFSAQHGGQEKQETTLAGFKIGVLAQ